MYDRRIKAFVILTASLLLVCLLRLAQMQLLSNSYYRDKITELKLQQGYSTTLRTVRGGILDRNNEVLAADEPQFHLRIDYMLTRFADQRFRKAKLLKAAKKNDAAVGISHSGRSAITVEALKIAGENGALTAGISNYLKSPLNKYSRYFFCTSFYENSVKVAAISSRIAQLCLIDALYLLAARYKNNVWDIENLNTLTEKLLRIEG